jgi:ABC-type uncharacterized transport system permease subunit
VDSLINILNISLPTLYALAWADYALLFFRDDAFAEKTASWLLYFTGTLHGISLLLLTIHQPHLPVATVFEAFSLLAFSVLVVYLLIESRIGVRTTGFFIVGFVFAFQLVSSAFITRPTEVNPLLADPSFVLHASTAVLGYSGMAISAIYGLLYLMLFYDIKKHRFGLIYKQLPSLEVMANFTYRAASLGFVFLSVAMVLGLALMVKVYGAEWKWDPKLTITLVAWLIYGASMAGRKFLGWSPRRIAFASLAGFAVILFSFVVVNFLFTSFHEFV